MLIEADSLRKLSNSYMSIFFAPLHNWHRQNQQSHTRFGTFIANLFRANDKLMIAVQAVAVYEPIVTSNYDAGNSRLAPTVTVVMVCLYAPVFTCLPLRACPCADKL